MSQYIYIYSQVKPIVERSISLITIFLALMSWGLYYIDPIRSEQFPLPERLDGMTNIYGNNFQKFLNLVKREIHY